MFKAQVEMNSYCGNLKI